jgi:hypothetical protein
MNFAIVSSCSLAASGQFMAAKPDAFTLEIFLRSFSSLNQLPDGVSGVV